MPKERTLILNTTQVNQKITRMAHEIYEHHYTSKDLILVGVKGNGSELATRLYDILTSISTLNVSNLVLSIDKDDPLHGDIIFTGNLRDLKGKQVVLVDDVLNSGRTLMYASRYLLEAEVKRLSIATLIDRFHRRFPMRANFVGLTLSTNLKEHVTVDFTSKKESVHLEA